MIQNIWDRIFGKNDAKHRNIREELSKIKDWQTLKRLEDLKEVEIGNENYLYFAGDTWRRRSIVPQMTFEPIVLIRPTCVRWIDYKRVAKEEVFLEILERGITEANAFSVSQNSKLISHLPTFNGYSINDRYSAEIVPCGLYKI